MIRLDTDDVLSLHKKMCKATGGISGIRDIGTLESAIFHAYASFEGKDLYPTIEEKVARQTYGIIRSHPFIDGNKRIGIFVMLVLLKLNNIKLKFTQSELVKLGISVAEGNAKPHYIEKWIIRHKEK